MGSVGTPTLWIAFNLFVLAMLAIDLGLFHRTAHEVSFKESAIWTAVWIGLSLVFNVIIYFWQGGTIAIDFLTGYLIEKSLSVDNIFVFVLIFSYFKVPPKHQHRVLFWGILGALVMRGLFIAVGTVLLSMFHWIIYVFGAFLIFTGIRMALHQETEIHPNENPLVRLARRFVPVTEDYEGQRFFIKRNGQRLATPLLLVLLLIESTDVIFALDSIPAIFAITRDPFIVYTSNVFAILGLRSLYFMLEGSVRRFEYLHFGLAAVLVFVGIKMLVPGIGQQIGMEELHIPTPISLGIIATILITSIVASLRKERRDERQGDEAQQAASKESPASKEIR